MLINILVRTSNRPFLFKRMLTSIEQQTYKNIRIIVSFDNDDALRYIPNTLDRVRVYKTSEPFFYDSYCNSLKELVKEGYFFFLDDDDVLATSNCIENICRHLNGNYGVICQFSRNGKIKPSNDLIRSRRIVRAKIGMPCIFLHHSCKNIADFDGNHGAADYTWIREVSKKVKLKFVPIVVALADRRSHGVLE